MQNPTSDSTGDPTVTGLTSRRRFVLELSTMATALAACSPSGEPHAGTDTATGTANQQSGRTAPPGTPSTRPRNADSRADTSLHHAMPGASTVAGPTPANVLFHRFDAALPALPTQEVVTLHFTARETALRVRDDTVVAAWTFEGDIPGPIVHVRQGQTVEFTLTNAGQIPHSMDFHAAQIDPKVAFRSVMPGQSITYTFKPKFAGAFLYHCGTAPVLMHLGSGMFGAIIVDPPAPLRRATEFVLIQSELYLGAAQNGISPFDYNKMLGTLPDLFAFNGRPDQYQAEPLRARRGDLVRFHVVNAGPTHPCAFHIVGEQFDTVYLGAPPGNAIHGVQTFDVPAGGGMVFEMQADVAGEFVFVNHSFGHGQKGAIGRLVIGA
ncbi:MAG TPA: multicopper oxidase domain-containing protein [Gemmatimonadaceae bacterium]|nr:multicopper oxidase domain-containing protein [Gemmatimonadaceae bacterium]